jgi:hypothetical protein
VRERQRQGRVSAAIPTLPLRRAALHGCRLTQDRILSESSLNSKLRSPRWPLSAYQVAIQHR